MQSKLLLLLTRRDPENRLDEALAERQVVTILIATHADHGMSGALDERERHPR
jgi:hypothetical protein